MEGSAVAFRARTDHGQAKPEGGPFPRRTLHTTCSLVLRDERLADSEAQTQPFSLATLHRYSFDLVIGLPDVRLFLFGETRSLVSHPDADSVLLDGQSNHDGLTGACIPQRIGDIVGEHLADAIPIG